MRLTRPAKMRAAALVLAAAVLLPLPARATVGGDTKVEVLGYARVDRKMYWLEVFEDASDRLPQLWFARTDGPTAGRPIAVRSWYPSGLDADEEDREVFERRLERLRTHVIPMIDTHAQWIVATDVTHTTTWPGGSEFGFVDRPQHTVRCELTHDAASAVGRPVTVTVFEDPEVRIASAFAVPGGDAGIVVLRYLGDPYETGYAIELGVPVLPE